MAALLDPRIAADTSLLTEGEIVTVIVGAEKRSFFIHGNLLQQGSGFFEAALKKEWEEGKTRTVELPEDKPTTFARYAHWLYCGKIASKEASGRGDYNILIELYILGEKLLHPAFQDRILDATLSSTREDIADENGGCSRWYPTKMQVGAVYGGTPKGSPFRRLMVDLHSMFGSNKWIDTENYERNNLEFLADLASALFARCNVKDTAWDELKQLSEGVPCSYHKHGKNESCSGKAS